MWRLPWQRRRSRKTGLSLRKPGRSVHSSSSRQSTFRSASYTSLVTCCALAPFTDAAVLSLYLECRLGLRRRARYMLLKLYSAPAGLRVDEHLCLAPCSFSLHGCYTNCNTASRQICMISMYWRKSKSNSQPAHQQVKQESFLAQPDKHADVHASKCSKDVQHPTWATSECWSLGCKAQFRVNM